MNTFFKSIFSITLLLSMAPTFNVRAADMGGAASVASNNIEQALNSLNRSAALYEATVVSDFRALQNLEERIEYLRAVAQTRLTYQQEYNQFNEQFEANEDVAAFNEQFNDMNTTVLARVIAAWQADDIFTTVINAAFTGTNPTAIDTMLNNYLAGTQVSEGEQATPVQPEEVVPTTNVDQTAGDAQLAQALQEDEQRAQALREGQIARDAQLALEESARITAAQRTQQPAVVQSSIPYRAPRHGVRHLNGGGTAAQQRTIGSCRSGSCFRQAAPAQAQQPQQQVINREPAAQPTANCRSGNCSRQAAPAQAQQPQQQVINRGPAAQQGNMQLIDLLNEALVHENRVDGVLATIRQLVEAGLDINTEYTITAGLPAPRRVTALGYFERQQRTHCRFNRRNNDIRAFLIGLGAQCVPALNVAW